MSPADRFQLPEDDSALVVLQDRQAVTAGQIRTRSQALSAELLQRRASRALVATDRADHLLMALFACRFARCDIVLHRGPAATERAQAVDADVVVTPELNAVPSGGIARAAQGRRPRVIIMTSGTGGIPKAAGHELERLAGMIPHGGPKSGARWLLTYHPASFAGVQVMLTALLGGAPLAAQSSPDIGALCQLAKEFAATSISGTPTFWRAFLMTLADDAAGIPLRHATLGGEAVDQATLDRIRTQFRAAQIAHIYASTEAGAVFAVKDGRAGFPASWLASNSVGVEMRVVNDVLHLRCPRLMTGYVSRHPSPVDDEGWLDTGDLVRIEGDRVLFSGRRDNVINVGGQKVRPEEVEALILKLPGVVDAHVKGISSPVTGQLVGVDIVAEPGAQETRIKESVREIAKETPAYAVPRVIRIVPGVSAVHTGKKSRS